MAARAPPSNPWWTAMPARRPRWTPPTAAGAAAGPRRAFNSGGRVFADFPYAHAIIGINLAVFAGWKFAEYRPGHREKRDALTFMHRHFMVSLESVSNGRLWTLLTANFSHQGFWHLALNMYMLWSFGSVSVLALGGPGFARLYLYGAAGCVAVALGADFLRYRRDAVAARRLGRGIQLTSHLGASGAVNALVVFACALQPMQQWLIWGVLPLPACVVAALFIGYDVYAAGSRDGVSHFGHLGGAAVGALSFLMFRRRMTMRFR